MELSSAQDTTSKSSTVSENSSSFGKTLKALRKKSGLTQAELAFTVGVHETSIRRWETGDRLPNAEYVKKLAEALHVNEQQLFRDEASGPSGWVLTIRVADSFAGEVIDVTKSLIPTLSSLTTTPTGAHLCLGGDYSIWTDDNNFKQLIADLRKCRAMVINSGKSVGAIKTDKN